MGICSCYFIYSNCDEITLTYEDCNGTEISEVLAFGENMYVCSTILPVITTGCPTPAQPILLGECTDGQCFSDTCYCWEVSCDIDNGLLYVDCEGTFSTTEYTQGDFLTICSKTQPQFLLSCLTATNTLIGICIGNECLPLPTTTTTTIPVTTTTTTLQPRPDVPIRPKNDCDPITIFPMGVNCFTIQPTFSDSYDGVVGLGITGGTPPFTILWDDGSVAPAKYNLGPGEYQATVTDYYGDFTANTTCILTAITTTTTTIAPTTTQKVYSDYCLSVNTTRYSGKSLISETEKTDYVYNGFFNDYPSWSSVTGNSIIYWSGGTLNSWIISGSTNSIITNNLYSDPTTGEPLPLTNWLFIGQLDPTTTVNSVFLTPGSCINVATTQLDIVQNDPICGCNGSITVQGTNGTPPYEYSIDGGQQYFTTPFFQNLCSGDYSVFVKDSLSVISSQQIYLQNPAPAVNYTATFSYTGPNSFEITISPPIPVGSTFIVSLEHLSTFILQPSTTPQTYNNIVTLLKNGTPVPSTNVPIVTTTILSPIGGSPCNSVQRTKTETLTEWSTITLTAGDTLNGTFTNSLSILPSQPNCYSANKDSVIELTNFTPVDNFDCYGDFLIINPPQYSEASLFIL
jgi:hypothetical protein